MKASSEPESMELRIKRINRLGDKLLESLKRCDYGLDILEDYRRGQVELHVHLSGTGQTYCGTYRHRSTGACSISHGQQCSVLVAVRQLRNEAEPCSATVRLQTFDGGAVGGVNAVEVLSFVSAKQAFGFEDRELGTVLLLARVHEGQFEDEVIEGASKTVGNLSNQDADQTRDLDVWDHEGEGDKHVSPSRICHHLLSEFFGNVWIRFEADGVRIRFLKPPFLFPEVVQVGFGPAQPCSRGVQRHGREFNGE